MLSQLAYIGAGFPAQLDHEWFRLRGSEELGRRCDTATWQNPGLQKGNHPIRIAVVIFVTDYFCKPRSVGELPGRIGVVDGRFAHQTPVLKVKRGVSRPCRYGTGQTLRSLPGSADEVFHSPAVGHQ